MANLQPRGRRGTRPVRGSGWWCRCRGARASSGPWCVPWDEAGIAVDDVVLRATTLDEAYLRITGRNDERTEVPA